MFKKNEFINVRQETEEEYIFLNTKTGETFLLNDIGYIIFECALKSKSMSELVKYVCQKTNDDIKAATKTIENFIKILLEKNILIQGDTTE
ncbi:conserved hypothetical protein [Caldicellulosiruptor hydrothermalis 108]|uniref:Coenzyme PQQ synthesis D n=1 Tax=Caldicellulosiruptor hydrothermalis (strain DSM 18901 / VKM B-2411 / 108) TaxID=632292 RepID=E4Q7T2_CALH1|nr:PqqD family protein [Caldicellulosiruptor hydrothermalis]ADQ06722.1 conserved hypothetical protein [Caldicellulosiruptor hydrothermalis 108]